MFRRQTIGHAKKFNRGHFQRQMKMKALQESTKIHTFIWEFSSYQHLEQVLPKMPMCSRQNIKIIVR